MRWCPWLQLLPNLVMWKLSKTYNIFRHQVWDWPISWHLVEILLPDHLNIGSIYAFISPSSICSKEYVFFFDVCSQIFRNLEIFILGRDSPVLPSLAGHIWLGQGLAVQRHGWAPESTCHGPVGHPITCLKTRWLWQGTRWHCTHVWLKLPGPSDNQNASRWECQEPW